MRPPYSSSSRTVRSAGWRVPVGVLLATLLAVTLASPAAASGYATPAYAGTASAIVAADHAGAAVNPRIMITLLFYDSPGVDNRSNPSLNAERIVLRNTTIRPINLLRWTVRDAQRHVYTFRISTVVHPGRSVVLHTGRGVNSPGHRYWGQGNYVWNNTVDTAYLRGPAGRLIDWCTYRGPNDQSPTGAFTRC